MMKSFCIAIFLLLSPIIHAKDDNLSISIIASFYNDPPMGYRATIEIDNNGKLSSNTEDILKESFQEESYETRLTDNSLQSLCKSVEKLNFFELNSSIAPDLIPYDGPVYFIEIECGLYKNKVRLHPGFEKSQLNSITQQNIDSFVQIWKLLWGYSEITFQTSIENDIYK